MRLPYNKELKHFAGDLRKNMTDTWVPLLACPAVFFYSHRILEKDYKLLMNNPTLLDKPAVAPVNQSVITFENCL